MPLLTIQLILPITNNKQQSLTSRVDVPQQHYKYVEINGRYYRLKQNPLILVWFMFLRSGPFQLCSSLGKGRVIKTAISLILHQLNFRYNSRMVHLSARGNLCLPVHRGYKVFDFRRKKVIRIISSGVSQYTVMKEIEGVRRASQLDFAPNVLRWDLKERWYEEDFVSGYPCYSNAESEGGGILKIFYRHIAPCLEQMILLQAPVPTNLMDYIKKAKRIIKDRELLTPELDDKKVKSISRYIESMVERLSPKKSLQIDLIFSHGDFSLVNILKRKEKIKVIDWEGVDRRSALFDLYNYFFTEMYYRRAKKSLVSEINEAISFLQLRLSAKLPELAGTLISLAPIYRKLYYLERVCMLLEREPTNKLLEVILRSIEVFNRYENGVAYCNQS